MKDIYAGWFLNGSGSPVQKNVRITIKNGRIVSISKNSTKDQDKLKTSESEILDLTDCTILPALIDNHVHLLMSGTMDQTARERQLEMRHPAAGEKISAHLNDHLSNGVLAVRDGGDKTGHLLEYKNNQFQAQNLPVQIKVAGRAWHKPGRYGKLIGRELKSPNTLKKVIQQETEKIDHIKIVNSGLNSLTEYGKETLPQFDVSDLKGAVSAANQRNLRIMVHANDKIPVQFAIDAGCHSIEHGFFYG